MSPQPSTPVTHYHDAREAELCWSTRSLHSFETKPDLSSPNFSLPLQVGEGDPEPLNISFLTGLMQKSFAFFMSQEKAKKEEEQSSLIIKL